MKNKRVIIDTNLWISFLISKKYNELDPLIKSGNIQLVFSSELIEEFLNVAKRPKFKKFFKNSDIQKLLSLMHNFGELITVNSKVDYCRDKKDNFLLNLSIDGKVDFLITGDVDLLVLGKVMKTQIVSWSDFISSF